MSQTTPARSESGTPSALRYLVDGMDCADCARQVEAMVGRLPGAAEPKINFTTQTLALALDEARTPRTTLERNIRSLGYEPRLQAAAAGSSALASAAPVERPADRARDESGHARDHGPNEDAKPWYTTRQGRLVISSGLLVALAFVLSYVAPAYSEWSYAAAVVVAAWPLARKAWAAARLGNPFSINALVTLASVGALLIGEAAEASFVVFLFAVGELLEGIAAGRARAGIRALANLAPKTAILLENGASREVPADGLLVGQIVRVQPGGRVPADGTIQKGSSSLDDSPLTGESVPVLKEPGDTVFAGSINTDGVLEVRVDREASDNTIARIIHMVEEAEASKSPTARFIDRFSRYYTPAVVLVSALVVLVPPLAFGAPWSEWIYRGLTLLLIGCPCALVLSTPAAITSGISAGARRGLLIKGGAALEAIGTVTTIAFDKTGTLTANKPRVTDLIPLAASEAELLTLAAAVETGSSHPLARAILDRAAADRLAIPETSSARAIGGRAAVATVNGREMAVGSPRYAAELAPLAPEVATRLEALESAGKTVVVLLDGARPLGLIAIRDEPRADARAAIAALGSLGVRSLMLTGDNRRTGEAIGADLGLEVRAELLPEDKLRLIGELKRSGRVAMIGDGINDAPALAQADVGIAMGGGTDVALETADAALLRDSVTGVPDLVRLSRATMTNIRQNITFALGLKAIFLVTTMLGYTTLWMAILADTGATALVTANALRLLGFRSSSERAAPAAAPARERVA